METSLKPLLETNHVKSCIGYRLHGIFQLLINIYDVFTIIMIIEIFIIYLINYKINTTFHNYHIFIQTAVKVYIPHPLL